MNNDPQHIKIIDGRGGEPDPLLNAGQEGGPQGNPRVLMIAYNYPPSAAGGAYRAGKITKFLPAFGWRPTVLTIGDDDASDRDYSVLEEALNAGVQIERVEHPRLLGGKSGKHNSRLMNIARQSVFQTDHAMPWGRRALDRARQIIDRDGAAVILATAPPFTSALIGYELHQASNIPLVLDYRDSWLEGADRFYLSPLHRGGMAAQEETILKSVDGVIAGNRGIKEQLVSRYTFLGHETVHIIYDGFDPQDIRTAAHLARPRQDGTFRLGLSSNMAGGDMKTIRKFFETLAAALGRNPRWREHFRLSIIGPSFNQYEVLAREIGVASALLQVPAGNHGETLRALHECDALLAIGGGYVVPAQLYDYIATRKPILSLASRNGVIGLTLAGYGAVTFSDPADPKELEELFNNWQSGELPAGNDEIVRQFDQRRLCEQLSRVLAYTVRI